MFLLLGHEKIVVIYSKLVNNPFNRETTILIGLLFCCFFQASIAKFIGHLTLTFFVLHGKYSWNKQHFCTRSLSVAILQDVQFPLPIEVPNFAELRSYEWVEGSVELVPNDDEKCYARTLIVELLTTIIVELV